MKPYLCKCNFVLYKKGPGAVQCKWKQLMLVHTNHIECLRSYNGDEYWGRRQHMSSASTPPITWHFNWYCPAVNDCCLAFQDKRKRVYLFPRSHVCHAEFYCPHHANHADSLSFYVYLAPIQQGLWPLKVRPNFSFILIIDCQDEVSFCQFSFLF